MIYDRKEFYFQLPATYKKTIKLDLLASDGRVDREYYMRAAFPTMLGSASLNYDSSEFLTFQVTFAMNDFISFGFPKASSGVNNP